MSPLNPSNFVVLLSDNFNEQTKNKHFRVFRHEELSGNIFFIFFLLLLCPPLSQTFIGLVYFLSSRCMKIELFMVGWF